MLLHFEQNQIHHIMIQAAFFTEIKQANEKTTTHVQHLMERVSSLESRSMAVEQLQDALEQRILQRQEVGSGDGSVVIVTPQGIQERMVDEHMIRVDSELGSCLEHEMRLQYLEGPMYDGVLLWKIDEFDRRKREAIDGTTMSLYSTPFYTGRHGYKMCAHIYLNGDGMGKNSHLSFFFVVMRGPFDGLLQWPFKQKVTLTLLNQAGKKHVSESFHPDPNSSSFQRPGRREMNIASGCPMFIRLEHLLNGGFVKDDCIYVRVVVDVFDLYLPSW